MDQKEHFTQLQNKSILVILNLQILTDLYFQMLNIKKKDGLCIML
jgi:hypothetical protein